MWNPRFCQLTWGFGLIVLWLGCTSQEKGWEPCLRGTQRRPSLIWHGQSERRHMLFCTLFDHRMWYARFSWSRKFHCYLAPVNSVGLVIVFERKWPYIVWYNAVRCLFSFKHKFVALSIIFIYWHFWLLRAYHPNTPIRMIECFSDKSIQMEHLSCGNCGNRIVFLRN